MRYALALAVLLGAAAGVWLVLDDDAAAEGAPTLRVGVAIPSYVHAVAWIARDRGFFAEHGVEVPEIQVMGGSAASVRALIAGGIDVALAGGDAALKANRAGADLVVVAGLVDRFYHRLVSRPAVKTADDLRGGTIGLPFLGGPQHMAALWGVEHLGLDPEEDVKIVSLGREFNRMAALTRGDIDATTSQAPPSVLDRLEVRVLVDLPAQPVRFPYQVVVVRRALLEESPDTVRRLVAALADAVAFYRDPANREASLEIVGAHLSGSDTRGARRERYEHSGPKLLQPDLRPSRAGFERVQEVLGPPESGKAEGELDRLLDLRLLE